MAATKAPKQPRKKLHSVNIRMDDWLRDGLRDAADEDGRTISNLGRKILEDWLKQREAAQRGEKPKR
jgi:hypothetical protein